VRFKSFALAFFFLLMTTVLAAQSSVQSPMQAPIQLPRIGPGANSDDRDNEQHAKLEKELAKKANRDRQAQLQRDTDSLLKLANELKQYVDKSNENTLSLDVVKKAEEIEKLAHSVKEKMKAN
jgi:methionyl-tRNA synthetase